MLCNVAIEVNSPHGSSCRIVGRQLPHAVNSRVRPNDDGRGWALYRTQFQGCGHHESSWNVEPTRTLRTVLYAQKVQVTPIDSRSGSPPLTLIRSYSRRIPIADNLAWMPAPYAKRASV